MKKILILLSAALMLTPIHAAITWAPTLSGTVQTDEWPALTASNYPGYGSFPGSGAWPSPIDSRGGESGDAVLEKVSNGTGGGPYPASGSIYFGGFSGDPNVDGGRLAVRDTTVTSGLKTVVFQIEIGEATTYDFYNRVLPTLSYNNGAQNLAATFSSVYEKVFNGTVTMPTGEEPIYINTYALQWDLSAISGITSISIEFNGVQHAQLYDLRLDQSSDQNSTNILPTPVPEPSVASILGLALLGMLRRRR